MNKTFYWGTGAGLALIILIIVGLASYNALYNLSSGRFTVKVASLVGLPVGFVNGHYLSYSDFQGDLSAVQNFYNFQKTQNPTLAEPTSIELQKSVWERIARQVVLEEQAKLAKITVSQEDLDQEFAKVIKELGSAETAEKMMNDTYGWSSEQFKKKVLTPFLLQERLTAATSSFDLEKEYAKSKVWKWIKI
ncbi:MAG: SurA N-terminal domain-containing protein [Candidatus Magasanikbacteria bacterium]|nr:SurA N-terminal domain-containing protein [Candidatus Magasanikbacteria bacterium]